MDANLWPYGARISRFFVETERSYDKKLEFHPKLLLLYVNALNFAKVASLEVEINRFRYLELFLKQVLKQEIMEPTSFTNFKLVTSYSRANMKCRCENFEICTL